MNRYNKKKLDKQIAKFSKHPELEQATFDLLEKIPEFKNSEFFGQTDDQIPYLVFGDFSNYIKSLAKKGKIEISDPLISRIANFIIDLYKSSSKDLKDLVLAGIFEDLASEPNTKVLAKFFPPDMAQDFHSFFSEEKST